MTTQLGFDGTEVEHPVPAPRPLSQRQREVLVYVRACFPVRPLDVGVLMHAGREHACLICAAGGHCEHASSDGADALGRLAARGLVTREARGAWVPFARDEREWAT